MTLSNVDNICLFALGNPSLVTPIDRRTFVSPYNNQIGDARYIDPATGDYLFNSSGKISGVVGVQQQVYLSLTTLLGSSASVNLGQTYNSIQVISNAITNDLSNAINSALAPLITNNSISLNGIIIDRPNNSTRLVATVSWTDLTLTSSQGYSPAYGAPQVNAAETLYDCAKSRGIAPLDLPWIEAYYRADMGVAAPNSFVSAWWNEAGYVGDVEPTFDMNRNAVQGTASKQPRFNQSDGYLNFQPSITFDNNRVLRTSSWTDGYMGDPVTIMCVGYWKDVTHTYKMFDGYGISSFYCQSTSGTLKIHETSDATGGLTNAAANVWIIVFNGSSSYYTQSSNTKVAFSGTPGESSPTGITLGGGLTDGFSGFTMAELAVFNTELSSGDQDGLRQYAHNRYGIGII